MGLSKKIHVLNKLDLISIYYNTGKCKCNWEVNIYVFIRIASVWECQAENESAKLWVFLHGAWRASLSVFLCLWLIQLSCLLLSPKSTPLPPPHALFLFFVALHFIIHIALIWFCFIASLLNFFLFLRWEKILTILLYVLDFQCSESCSVNKYV